MMNHKYITLRSANAYIEEFHRHNGRVTGGIFALGLYRDSSLVGVAILGRPISRRYDYTLVCEITRLCTTGTENACSILYGAMARIAKDMGFMKVITYTLKSEKGTSLKAAGFKVEARNCGGRSRWNGRKNLIDKYPDELKTRWARDLSERT